MPISAHLERAFLERVRGLPPASQRLLLVAATDESGELHDRPRRRGAAGRRRRGPRRGRAGRAHPGARDDPRAAPPARALGHLPGSAALTRRAAHGALAAVLVGEARADRRAWHRAAASVDPEPAVVDELEGAARRAQARGGYDAASLAYERAAALAADERRRARLLTAAAESAWLPGQVPRAVALLRRARSQSRGARACAPTTDRLRGVIELTCGVPADSSQILAGAADAVAAADPERALYLLSLASWGAAFARDRDAIVAIASGPSAWGRRRACHRLLRTRLAGLRAHFTRDFDAAAECFRTTLALVEGGRGRAPRSARPRQPGRPLPVR